MGAVHRAVTINGKTGYPVWPAYPILCYSPLYDTGFKIIEEFCDYESIKIVIKERIINRNFVCRIFMGLCMGFFILWDDLLEILIEKKITWYYFCPKDRQRWFRLVFIQHFITPIEGFFFFFLEISSLFISRSSRTKRLIIMKWFMIINDYEWFHFWNWKLFGLRSILLNKISIYMYLVTKIYLLRDENRSRSCKWIKFIKKIFTIYFSIRKSNI